MQKYGRHEVPSVLNSPQKILILKGFATLRDALNSAYEAARLIQFEGMQYRSDIGAKALSTV